MPFPVIFTWRKKKENKEEFGVGSADFVLDSDVRRSFWYYFFAGYRPSCELIGSFGAVLNGSHNCNGLAH